jgi:hypothetical protein
MRLANDDSSHITRAKKKRRSMMLTKTNLEKGAVRSLVRFIIARCSPRCRSSGPMTWHAKALTTSYVTAPDAGAKGGLGGRVCIPVRHRIPRRG